MGILVFIGALYLIAWVITGVSCKMSPYRLFFLIKRTKANLKKVLKPEYELKTYELDWAWGKTEFGDYKTKWKLINMKERTSESIELCVDKHGNVMNVDSWSKKYLDKALLV